MNDEQRAKLNDILDKGLERFCQAPDGRGMQQPFVVAVNLLMLDALERLAPKPAPVEASDEDEDGKPSYGRRGRPRKVDLQE